MRAKWPTTSEQKHVYLHYVGHIAIMMGKDRDTINIEGINTIADLLSKLDEETPGIKKLFMPPDDVFNVRTGISLRRLGQGGRAVIDPQEKIEDNDDILLW